MPKFTHSGTVKFYNATKGFGFILDAASGKDIFFHISNASENDFRKDQKVQYNVAANKKGPEAVDVASAG